MKHPDKLWYDIVYRFAKQSRCRSRKVGAVIVDEYGHLIGQGWNSAPIGSVTEDCPRCNSTNYQSGKDLHLAICTHAEINAIAHAARTGKVTNGSSIYCTCKPCVECTKAIISAGIVEVVYDCDYDSPLTETLFNNAEVKFRNFGYDVEYTVT